MRTTFLSGNYEKDHLNDLSLDRTDTKDAGKKVRKKQTNKTKKKRRKKEIILLSGKTIQLHVGVYS
jgi:hypothetical protein